MVNIFKPEFLGGEYNLDNHVRIFYKKNYTNEEDWGFCDYENKDDFFYISINIPSLKQVKSETKHNSDLSRMLYLSIGGHEEAHALQMSGNFTHLISWINSITKLKLSKLKAKNWDKLWEPSEKVIVSLDKQFGNFSENLADIAEIFTLLYKRYSKKEILYFAEMELQRINSFGFHKKPLKQIYKKNLMNFLES